MPIQSIIAFWAVSILFVITPGADWAYSITAGIRHRSIWPALAGLLAGHLTATVIVALGVAAIIAKIPFLMGAMTVAGALYLIWLGFAAAKEPSQPQTMDEVVRESGLKQALRGYAISGLNPKVFLLFLALLPQFTVPEAKWPVALQIVFLGAIHTISCGLVYAAVGLGARFVLQAKPSAARMVSRISGGAMIRDRGDPFDGALFQLTLSRRFLRSIEVVSPPPIESVCAVIAPPCRPCHVQPM